MALLTVNVPTLAGVTEAPVAASAGGDTFPAGEHTFLRVSNTSGASRTVTIASPTPCNQGFSHPDPVIVITGTIARIGPFPAGRWGDTNGLVTATYSSQVGLLVEAVAS